jgi:hypothetical protein
MTVGKAILELMLDPETALAAIEADSELSEILPVERGYNGAVVVSAKLDMTQTARLRLNYEVA